MGTMLYIAAGGKSYPCSCPSSPSGDVHSVFRATPWGVLIGDVSLPTDRQPGLVMGASLFIGVFVIEEYHSCGPPFPVPASDGAFNLYTV